MFVKTLETILSSSYSAQDRKQKDLNPIWFPENSVTFLGSIIAYYSTNYKPFLLKDTDL